MGLQPFEAPDPLPPIEEDEVKLVCWMAIAPHEEQDTDGDRPSLISQVSADSFG